MVQTVPIGVQKKVGKQINLIGLSYEIGAAIAKGMVVRACGLACAKHAMDPPSRGWRTQEDLLEGKDWGDLVEFDQFVTVIYSLPEFNFQ